MNNETILNTLCKGCSACAIICPHNAITMKYDDIGGYSKSINHEKCVNCRQCESVCPDIYDYSTELSKDFIYSAVCKDKEVLKNSSSGGVAYVMAKEAIENGWSVCGVTYNSQKECAEHIVVENIENLKRIQGSKYLQSACEPAFREIIAKDSAIIFGTPCQISGIDAVLKKKKVRDRFILVDIFCHGVPSQLLWKQHLKYLRDSHKIDDNPEVRFREGKEFIITIGKYKAWYNEDAFYTYFLRGWLNNESCYHCNYRRSSVADIRLGDCLLDKYHTLSYSPSCIIANTERGVGFLNKVGGKLELNKEEFGAIDTIQQKENVQKPAECKEWINKLIDGKYPEELIKWILFKGRVKSFIKHRLLKDFKSY